MTTPFYVSQSKVSMWLTCRLKYWFRYVENLKPRVKARPLKFGSMVHKMVEAEARGDDPFKTLEEIAVVNRKLFEAEREMYGAIVQDVEYIMRAYQSYWKKEPLTFIRYQGRKAEHPFEVEVTRDIVAKGKIDALIKYRRSIKVLGEHKTHKDFPNDDHRWRNIQSAIYLRVLDMLGLSGYEGTLWNYVRSKPPTRPQILKDGSLSTRALDSLPAVVIDVAREAGIPATGYADLVKDQENRLPSWFQRVYTPIKPKVVKALFAEFVNTAREMSDWFDRNPNKRPMRTIAKHCDWCAYEAICRAELQGNDVDFLLEREYVVDKTDYQDEEDGKNSD